MYETIYVYDLLGWQAHHESKYHDIAGGFPQEFCLQWFLCKVRMCLGVFALCAFTTCFAGTLIQWAVDMMPQKL